MMALAACGSEEKKAGEGTEVAFNAEGDGGGIKIQTGKDGGKIRIGGDGAAINIDVPDFVDLDVASDFDIDGVKLYPGSTVTKVDVDANDKNGADKATVRSEEHTSELQSLMRISYAVFCLKKKNQQSTTHKKVKT